MPKQNMVARRQGEALRLEVLRRYFDFRDGRPTAAKIAEEMELSPDTVETWLADPDNAHLLDEIVPLWPNLGGAREFASEQVIESLTVIRDVMRGSMPETKPKDRLEAAKFLLALAGVRPSDQVQPEPAPTVEQKRPAVLLNLFLGGSPEKDIRVIDGEVRPATPSRIAGAAIAALGLSEPGSGGGVMP